MATQTFSIGGISFSAPLFEVPTDFKHGSETVGSIHRVPQNEASPPKIIIQTWGVFPKRMTWEAWFLGTQAESKMRALKALQQAQRSVPLVLGSKSWDVVIFNLEFMQHSRFEIKFTIEVEPLTERMGVIPPGTATGAVGAATNLKTQYTNIVAVQAAVPPDARVSALNAQLTTVASGITNNQPETQQTITSLLTLAATLTSTIATARTLSGTLSGSADAKSETAYLWVQTALQALSSYSTTLASVTGQDKGNAPVVNNGDLFRIAATQLGDWTRWADLAALNPAFVDVFLTGQNQVTIPRI